MRKLVTVVILVIITTLAVSSSALAYGGASGPGPFAMGYRGTIGIWAAHPWAAYGVGSMFGTLLAPRYSVWF